MPDWVDVVRRLLSLYKVKTQIDLGMAMGMPIDIGNEADIRETGLSWKILEKAVSEKNVSWDWLMTGRGEAPEGVDAPKEEPQKDGEKKEAEPPPPAEPPARFETRELARELLNQDDKCPPARELEQVKAAMQREIDRVNEILGE